MGAEVQDAVAALERLVRVTESERELAEQLADGLERLRAAYRHDKAAFAPTDLQRLWFADYVRELALELMRVRQQLASVRDPRAYPGLECALTELEEGLRDTALVERVRKELAWLAANASERAARADLEEARAVAREKEMEVRAEPCARGHRMVLRNGKRGLFWGCSRYPKCRETRDLVDEERRLTR